MIPKISFKTIEVSLYTYHESEVRRLAKAGLVFVEAENVYEVVYDDHDPAENGDSSEKIRSSI